MTDFTTMPGATVARPTRVHHGRCALCDDPIAGGRARRYCTPSCRQQAAVNRQRKRTRDLTPEQISQRNTLARAYRQTDASRRAQAKAKRQGRLDGTQGHRTREVYLASMKRRNYKRRKRNRAWAREHHQTKYPTGLGPPCATCGAEITYKGRGRSRKRCPAHHLGRGARR